MKPSYLEHAVSRLTQCSSCTKLVKSYAELELEGKRRRAEMALERDELAAIERAAEVRAQWGHPIELWQSLIGNVHNGAIRDFSEVGHEWLSYMWCLDQYR